MKHWLHHTWVVTKYNAAELLFWFFALLLLVAVVGGCDKIPSFHAGYTSACYSYEESKDGMRRIMREFPCKVTYQHLIDSEKVWKDDEPAPTPPGILR